MPSRRSYLATLAGCAAALGGCVGRSGPSTGTGTAPGTRTGTDTTTDRSVPSGLSGAWTHRGADARATRSTDTEPLDAAPERLWSADIGESYRQVLLAGEALYTATDTRLARRSLADGSVVWERSFDGRARLGAALEELYLTVGGDEPTLRALAPAGTEPPSERWIRDGVRFRRADDDLVLATADDGGRLYGLEPDGGRRWSLDAGDVDLGVDVEGERFDSVVLGPDHAFAAVESGGSAAWVAGIERGSGRTAWTDTGPNHAGLLTVTPDAVLSGGFHGTVATWGHGGEERWRTRTTPPVGAIAVADGRALVSANADSTPAVTALDGAGEELWTRPTGTVIAVDAGVAYVTDGEGFVALDPETGERRWRVDVPAVQVVPADGGLFVLDGTALQLFA